METEIVACIKDINIKYLESGQVSKVVFPMERGKAHKQQITHLITRFFIISQAPNGDIKYLVQKRSKNKKEYPEYYTDSSSGHVIWEKNLDLKKIQKDALRELEEEFGIPSRALLHTKFYELNDEKDNKEREISYVFFGLVDYNIDLKPDPDELDIKESRFYERYELEKILENEKSIKYPKKIWKELFNTDTDSFFENKLESKISHNKNIALFIGRFQPLHHGHIHILMNILKSYKTVKIGIGSSQLSNTFNDPFTNIERQEFIKAALKKRRVFTKRYHLYDIPDIFNAKRWVDHVTSIVGEFDAIFSNSDWIRELFQNKGLRVEKKIVIFKKKFNASSIRRLITKNNKSWKPLVPKEVVELIEKYDGINRLKSLNTTDSL
ncbi:MAG: nicotinamide-nucleotide adenylyltransferase [Candidatus Lokiarchaeota archaeon]|nr:nicotinamide-nucleotide adenylyltransferase [Candidatus Lokiarchaeota archaeon]